MATKRKKSTRTSTRPRPKATSFRVVLEQPDFDGELAAFVFDSAGGLLEQQPVKRGRVTLTTPKPALMRSRVFIAPMSDEAPDDRKPTIERMRSLDAYSPVLAPGHKLVDTIRIPRPHLDRWLLCLCLVTGRVTRSGSQLPVCGAKVHICEVDKFWRWIVRLPELEVLRLRDELLEHYEKPELRRPPRLEELESAEWQEGPVGPPDPDPGPMADPAAIRPAISRMTATRLARPASVGAGVASGVAALGPRPELPEKPAIRPLALPATIKAELLSPSIHMVRDALIKHLELVRPFLCLWPYWWRYECDEIAVVETDSSGRFEKLIVYPCTEIHGDGATTTAQGLTTGGAPFGGKIEPRVWFSRTTLLGKGIRYHRWSYRRLTEGDGTPLSTPGPWTAITRTVVRHYARQSGSQVTHVPFVLGPQPVGPTSNLFEIKPPSVPTGGIEWSVVDEREDLASAHFESDKLGVGTTRCARALDAAGKYELKLELFKDGTGALVDWTAEGIDLEMTDLAAPFGTNTVTTDLAPDFNRIKNAAGHTMAFRMVLHIDNNCCHAAIDELTGFGLTASPCGFYDVTATSTVKLGVTARHPNDFATFSFSVKKGTTEHVKLASAAGRVGLSSHATLDTPSPSHSYSLTGSGHYDETFTAAELRGVCARAAFSEALHVWTLAQDGYGRLWTLDRFTHAGFALTMP